MTYSADIFSLVNTASILSEMETEQKGLASTRTGVYPYSSNTSAIDNTRKLSIGRISQFIAMKAA